MITPSIQIKPSNQFSLNRNVFSKVKSLFSQKGFLKVNGFNTLTMSQYHKNIESQDIDLMNKYSSWILKKNMHYHFSSTPKEMKEFENIVFKYFGKVVNNFKKTLKKSPKIRNVWYNIYIVKKYFRTIKRL